MEADSRCAGFYLANFCRFSHRSKQEIVYGRYVRWLQFDGLPNAQQETLELSQSRRSDPCHTPWISPERFSCKPRGFKKMQRSFHVCFVWSQCVLHVKNALSTQLFSAFGFFRPEVESHRYSTLRGSREWKYCIVMFDSPARSYNETLMKIMKDNETA